MVKIISPFAPHIAEELWRRIGHDGTIFDAPWPEYDEAKLKSDFAEFRFMVNKRPRDRETLPVDISDQELFDRAAASASVQSYIVSNNLTIDFRKAE